jgi:hypothetical protein
MLTDQFCCGDSQLSKPPSWPSIVVLSCTGIVAAGLLALIGWIALALLGY